MVCAVNFVNTAYVVDFNSLLYIINKKHNTFVIFNGAANNVVFDVFEYWDIPENALLFAGL